VAVIWARAAVGCPRRAERGPTQAPSSRMRPDVMESLRGIVLKLFPGRAALFGRREEDRQPGIQVKMQ
jgi:hypothetical protein